MHAAIHRSNLETLIFYYIYTSAHHADVVYKSSALIKITRDVCVATTQCTTKDALTKLWTWDQAYIIVTSWVTEARKD